MSTILDIYGGTFAYLVALPVMVIWLLSTIGTSKVVRKPRLLESENFLTTNLGVGQGFVVGILVVSLVAISERILFDLSRTLVGPGYDYFQNLQTIMLHAVFVVPVFAVFVLANILAGEHRKKYAIILMPYFVTAMFLVVQLIVEISAYFSNHHTKAQLYIVLICIAFMASYAIWYVQNLYNQRLKELE